MEGSYQKGTANMDYRRPEESYDAVAADPSCHPLSCFLSCIFPCVWLGACYPVEVNEEVVELNWGKFVGLRKQPGCTCSNPCGRTLRKVSTKQISHTLQNVTVIDKNGNPLLISGVVTYYWENTVRTALEVEQPERYVELLGIAVLKTVISKFPYETLKAESDHVSQELIANLQARVGPSGARIINLSLNEIAYATEVAGAMLKRQQAFAIVEARQYIVQGAVDVATEACDELNEKGHNLSNHAKSQIVRNLLTLLCSEKTVQPVIVMSK